MDFSTIHNREGRGLLRISAGPFHWWAGLRAHCGLPLPRGRLDSAGEQDKPFTTFFGNNSMPVTGKFPEKPAEAHGIPELANSPLVVSGFQFDVNQMADIACLQTKKGITGGPERILGIRIENIGQARWLLLCGSSPKVERDARIPVIIPKGQYRLPQGGGTIRLYQVQLVGVHRFDPRVLANEIMQNGSHAHSFASPFSSIRRS
jgi:hypothetical protein